MAEASMQGYHEYGMGATTVGLRGKNYVVLASEKRVSYGGFIVSKSGKKVFKVSDRIGIACAGLFADMQVISKMLAAEIEYYEISVGKPISIRSAARLLAYILYTHKDSPFISEVLVGGVDLDGGARLYVMDPLGSLMEDDYAALGSGAPIAIGILESKYDPDAPVERGVELAVEAVKVSIARDAISGDGIDVLTIYVDDKGKVRAEERCIRF